MPPEPTPTALPAPTGTQAESAPEGMSIQRITVISASVLGGVIVITFIIGLLFALFGSTEVTASRIQIIRDIFLIVMGLEAVLIVGALAVLVVQAARLINLLNSESKPVLQNAQATSYHQ